jgi:HK97 gp10 family phage protein
MAYIKGLDRLNAKLAKLLPAMQEAAVEAIEQGLVEIREDAQQLAPVESGDLRDSIRTEMRGNEGKVVVGVDYGAFVEMGTYDTEAQPYLYPAYTSNKEQIKQDIRNKARAALREVAGN